MARRYWKIDRGDGTTSLAVTEDGDLRSAMPAAEELTVEAHATESVALAAASARPAPIITPLIGNGLSHSTNAAAKKVIVRVNAPDGGPKRARPTIDDQPVTVGDYTYDRPGKAIEVKTNAGNNDVLVSEEF
jgi:hypothetical protein